LRRRRRREKAWARLSTNVPVSTSSLAIANDPRFDRNKPTYKTTLDFTFWEGSHGPRTDPALLQVIRRYPLPQAITIGRLVPWCADRMTPFGPIHHWLVTHTN
jgi:hypothetical protein